MKRIFLSHDSRESEHANYLKEIIEFICRRTDVWLSNINPGDNWFKKIMKELENCDATMILLSPASVHNPWVLFESGASIILNKKVFPILYCGLEVNDMPEQLKHIQATYLNKRDSVNRLLTSIYEANVNDVNDVNRFIAGLDKFDYFQKLKPLEPIKKYPPAISDSVTEIRALSDSQRKLFEHINEHDDNSGILESDIRKNCSIYYTHRNESLFHKKLQISPSEYYYRLRELYFLGLIEYQPKAFNNKWRIRQGIKEKYQRWATAA